MNRDKSDNTIPPLAALSEFRGIYKRVAVQLDIDPSYVSRVARGERNAPVVSEALRQEIQRVMGSAGLHNGDGKNHASSNGTAPGLRNGNQRGEVANNGLGRGASAKDDRLARTNGNRMPTAAREGTRKLRGNRPKKSASGERRRKP
jgi:hypothetical protein